MISIDIVNKIKNLEIHTKKMVGGLLIGQGRSVAKGSGLEFDQIRDYQVGDDIRSIDWKSSARMNKMLVKQYREDKSQTVLVLVDISQSSWYGTSSMDKYEVISRIASIISLICSYRDDAVGLILFSETVEHYVPPMKGRKHIHAVLKTLFEAQAINKKTNICTALDYVAQLKKKNMIVFMLSDFIDNGFEKSLSLVARQHDVIAVSCLDKCENEMPALGFLTIQDQESGETLMLDLSRSGHSKIEGFLKKRVNDQHMIFKQLGVDSLTLSPQHDNDQELIKFFRKRMMY